VTDTPNPDDDKTTEPLGREIPAMVFTDGSNEYVTADGLRELLDSNDYTWILTGGRELRPYLDGDELHYARNADRRRWIIAVANGRVTSGFLLEDDVLDGELVICLLEEDGLGTCPRDICRYPGQTCRNPSW
jgi:hypothetical protein